MILIAIKGLIGHFESIYQALICLVILKNCISIGFFGVNSHRLICCVNYFCGLLSFFASGLCFFDSGRNMSCFVFKHLKRMLIHAKYDLDLIAVLASQRIETHGAWFNRLSFCKIDIHHLGLAYFL